MSRREIDRLNDIRDAIVAINRHIADAVGETSVRGQALLHDALMYQFVVIGEAVKNLDVETRAMAPEIPWAQIAGLRDMIAHEYFRIEIDRILEIVEAQLPQLEIEIDRMISG